MELMSTHSALSILGIALAGGIIGLDRTAAGQFMVSQPLVAAPLIAWMLGDPMTGLVVGAALELVWLMDMPVGTFVPADSTVASIFASAAAVLGSGGEAPLHAVGFSVLLTVLLAPLTIASDRFIRQFNARLGSEERFTGRLPGATITRSQVIGIAVFFLRFFLLLLVCVPLGAFAVREFLGMPEVLHRAMGLYIKLLPLLGAAVIIRKLSIKLVDWSLLAGFAAAAGIGLAVRAPAFAVVVLSAAAGWLGALYRERHP